MKTVCVEISNVGIFLKKRQLETIRGWVYAYVDVLSIFYKLKWYENRFLCSEYRWYVPATLRAINQYKQINSWIYSMFYRAWITKKKQNIYLSHVIAYRHAYTFPNRLNYGLENDSHSAFLSCSIQCFGARFCLSLSLSSSLWLVRWLGRSFSLSSIHICRSSFITSLTAHIVYYLLFHSKTRLSLCLSFSQNLIYAAAVCFNCVYLVQNAHLFLLVWQ